MLTRPRLFLFILLVSVTLSGSAQLKIRLFRALETETIIASVVSGSYLMVVDSSKQVGFAEGDMVYIKEAGGKILVNSRSGISFIARSIQFDDVGSNSIMELAARQSSDKEEITNSYEGSFSVGSRYGNLLVINIVDQEKYVAAVVQAEGGYKGHSEYLKTQAILARTYTMMHLDRHMDEGYNLCDGVHCQAYRGRSVTGSINRAVDATHGLVVTDRDSTIVLTPFHSNCGGETLPSEWVWLTAQSHLVPVTDPYCLDSRNARWERKIGREDWLSGIGISDSLRIDYASDLGFTQNTRLEYYITGSVKVPLESIRSEFGLRSTFFSVTDQGDSILLSGRGYGHGVGLCQEGAMVMAARGYSWEQIIRFYFRGVIILNEKDARLSGSIERSF